MSVFLFNLCARLTLHVAPGWFGKRYHALTSGTRQSRRAGSGAQSSSLRFGLRLSATSAASSSLRFGLRLTAT
jgi:hypothetical protein